MPRNEETSIVELGNSPTTMAYRVIPSPLPQDNSDAEGHSEHSDWDDENQMVIRAKWILDSCNTIEEIIDRLREEIRYYETLKNQGWDLTGPVDDDYGYMRKNH